MGSEVAESGGVKVRLGRGGIGRGVLEWGGGGEGGWGQRKGLDLVGWRGMAAQTG